MRLRRSVLAGLVAGVVAGFLVALLRPRGTHPAAGSDALSGHAAHPGTAPARAPLVGHRVDDDLPSIAPAVAPGEAAWEAAESVPGVSRRVRRTDSPRATD